MTALYPRDVATAVWNAWPAWLKVDPKKVLPADAILHALVDTAYQASLQTEEQRMVSFRLAYGPPTLFEDEHGRLFPTAIRFGTPRAFTPHEVVRLAPATDPARLMIGVDGDADTLAIWGLADTGAGRYRQLEGDLSDATAPDTPDALIISVFRPGELRLAFGDTPLVELAAGEIVPILQQATVGVFGKGPIAAMFDDAQKRFLRLIEKASYDPPLDRADVMQEFGVCFERLLLEIRGKRHGGAILVVPNGHLERVASEVLAVKYPCQDNRLWLSLGANLGAKRNYRTLAGFLFPKAGTTAGEIVSAAKAVSDRGAEVADVVSFIASLSSVDGAIVLTDDLQLFGFGAVVLPGNDVAKVHFATDDEGNTVTERQADDFGTRHRSAFRFCATVPTALAFVISQDGDVKAIKNVDGHVTVWPHILSNRLSGKPGFLGVVQAFDGAR